DLALRRGPGEVRLGPAEGGARGVHAWIRSRADAGPPAGLRTAASSTTWRFIDDFDPQGAPRLEVAAQPDPRRIDPQRRQPEPQLFRGEAGFLQGPVAHDETGTRLPEARPHRVPDDGFGEHGC